LKNAAILAAPALLAMALLAACAGTPEAVNQLAERTGANAGVLGAQLARLDSDSREVAQLRAQSIARLHLVNQELRAHYNLDLALSRKAGQASDLALIELIKNWQKEVDGIYKGLDEAEANRKAQILARVTKLDIKAAALKGVADRLAKLGEMDKPEDRARFLAGFIKEVGADVNRELEKADTPAKGAKALIKNIEGSFSASGARK
jgi:hypothetical protein